MLKDATNISPRYTQITLGDQSPAAARHPWDIFRQPKVLSLAFLWPTSDHDYTVQRGIAMTVTNESPPIKRWVFLCLSVTDIPCRVWPIPRYRRLF